ncbi:hypothetical protein BDA99DRAFT_499566 [Phascolomyces articulosus]|uniref:3-dehydrosphinganine reductase n=1 Tax=Phascolomyces articulosus TaxID=60185 RepID=A0AAD5PHK8_9FUNG|nr:hypothetical protein BDA99DRAFT_499566 [Phascolomyces articulosus]
MSVPAWASVLIALGAVAVVALSADHLYNRITRNPFKPAKKHCFITGGSTGLGKSLAMELIKKGANVTIVARRQSELDKAAREIETCKINEDQRVVTISADMTSKEDVVRALEEAKVKMGVVPEIVCTCAGASYPKNFCDYTLDDFEYLTKLNYLGQAYVAHQATIMMRDNNVKNGKIVFVSSMLGLLSFAGYATYSPTKFAVRGLADTLRNELKRYNIDVHIFFPGNIDSPGYVVENSTKPDVTKTIEGLSPAMDPKDCAKALLSGLYSGHYMITTEFIGELLRCATRGVNPSNNYFIDSLLALIAQPVGSIYALFMDFVAKRAK